MSRPAEEYTRREGLWAVMLANGNLQGDTVPMTWSNRSWAEEAVNDLIEDLKRAEIPVGFYPQVVLVSKITLYEVELDA